MANRDPGTYFWYAVGEILLVVVGIVIALQIDNWNDERVEQREIREYLQNLVGDIQRDFVMLEPVESQIKRKLSSAGDLSQYMQGKTLDEIHNIDLCTYVMTGTYRPYAWNRAALEQIKSSGALRQIKDQLLVTKISEYDALSKHLDQDFQGDQAGMQQVEAAVMKVMNTNYPNIQQIRDFEDDSEEYDYIGFLKSDLYRQTKATDLPLLTDDINEVISATNYYSEIVDKMGARTGHEIPRLREYGQEIIDLVAAHYQ